MKKTPARNFFKAFLRTVLILVALAALCAAAFVGICLFQPEFIVDKLPYDVVHQYLLYDHIQYNGVDYYLLDGDRPEYLSDGIHLRFTVEEDCIVLVDKDGVPYDEERAEDGWIFANDPDVIYLEFNSATYTRNKELALDIYDFRD